MYEPIQLVCMSKCSERIERRVVARQHGEGGPRNTRDRLHRCMQLPKACAMCSRSTLLGSISSPSCTTARRKIMKKRKESTHACEKKNQNKNKNTTHIQKKSGPKPRENFAEALFREPRRGTLIHTYTSNRQRFEATIAQSDVTSNLFRRIPWLCTRN